MLVSAVSASSFQTVFNTGIKGLKEQSDAASKGLSDTPDNTQKDSPSIFDSINEWKYFCHEQILQGKLDIIA